MRHSTHRAERANARPPDSNFKRQVLEPKDGRSVGKDWESLGSEIGALPLLGDDEQPLPTNVMYPGTSNFWRNDDYEE